LQHPYPGFGYQHLLQLYLSNIYFGEQTLSVNRKTKKQCIQAQYIFPFPICIYQILMSIPAFLILQK